MRSNKKHLQKEVKKKKRPSRLYDRIIKTILKHIYFKLIEKLKCN